MKKKRIIIFTCAALLFSQSVSSFAWSISGVTRPYDPANYWTHNTISWPDSKPSIYMLRDIARNGGQVIDYQNLDPNTVKDVKAVLEFTARLNELLTEIKNLIPFGSSPATNLDRFLNTVQRADSVVDQAEDSCVYLANGDESSDTQLLAKGFDEKYQFLDESYKTAYDYAKKEAAAYEERSTILMDAVERIEETQGRLAAEQSQTEMAAISTFALLERNKLITQRNALEVLKNRAETDEIIRAETNIRNKLAVQFADPYRPTEYDHAVYTKKKAPGMPDFAN
jgi:hypothetical protein